MQHLNLKIKIPPSKYYQPRVTTPTPLSLHEMDKTPRAIVTTSPSLAQSMTSGANDYNQSSCVIAPPRKSAKSELVQDKHTMSNMIDQSKHKDASSTSSIAISPSMTQQSADGIMFAKNGRYHGTYYAV